MLKFKNNRYLYLRRDEFRRVVNAKHPELIKDSEALNSIDITSDRLSRYLSSKEEEISVEFRTALNLCNFFNVPPCAFFITDGSIAHCENNVAPEAGSNQVSEGEDDLYLTDDMDDVLRTASTGLEKSDGSQERVSYAIARITGYLRTIIFRAPELKERVHGLVTSIVVALSASVLDSDHSSMELLCTEIKRCIVALSECEQIQLPKQARKDASDAISMMQVARLDGDDNMRLRAIKAALYWINDYWSLICMKQSAYDMLSAISCTLSSAPTDNKTRSRLVTYLNSFASDVAIYDPVNKMLHGGEQK